MFNQEKLSLRKKLDNLISRSFEVSLAMKIANKKTRTTKSVVIDINKNREGTYNVYRDQMIAFVDGNTLYTIPYSEGAVKILLENSFTLDEEIFIPFIDGEFPISFEEKWESILRNEMVVRRQEI